MKLVKHYPYRTARMKRMQPNRVMTGGNTIWPDVTSSVWVSKRIQRRLPTGIRRQRNKVTPPRNWLCLSLMPTVPESPKTTGNPSNGSFEPPKLENRARDSRLRGRRRLRSRALPPAETERRPRRAPRRWPPSRARSRSPSCGSGDTPHPRRPMGAARSRS